MRLFILLAFFPSSFLTAQSAFLKDPDIIWATEIEQDWVVDIPSLETEWNEGITTLKLLRTPQNESYWSSPYLADMVYQAAMDGKLPVFKDARCQAPIQDLRQYLGMSTVITFDPETYEEKVLDVFSDLTPSRHFKAWRLRQILAYHAKSATWSTTVEAIAPLMLENPRDSSSLRPLFWFRPGNKRPKLSSNHIVWAKKTMNKQPGTLVPADPKQPVKLTDGFQNPLTHLFGVLATNMKTPFYGTWDDKPLTPAERTAMLASPDTVVTFDPETYEEKVEIVRNELNVSDVRQLRLVQSWYWDERRRRLSICLDAVAPLIEVRDEYGNFRYQRPLFYRRVKR